MSLGDRLERVLGEIASACEAAGRDPTSVDLLPISKRHPSSSILEATRAGRKVFGENRVSELAEKATELEASSVEVTWQMVGSVQTNKVRPLIAVPGLALLQSLDRIKLADTLQRELHREGRSLPVLLQVNATGEENKHGVLPDAAADLLRHVVQNCPRLDCVGLMAMGPLAGDSLPVFRRVAQLSDSLRDEFGMPLETMSLGMTDDLHAAIAAGSTMVRVGTGVFGPRSN